MARPRKVLTKAFKSEIIDQLNRMHPFVNDMRQYVDLTERVNEYLNVLHGMFSKIELMVRAREKEVNRK